MVVVKNCLYAQFSAPGPILTTANYIIYNLFIHPNLYGPFIDSNSTGEFKTFDPCKLLIE